MSAAALIRAEVAASSEAYEHEYEVVGGRHPHSFRSDSLSPDVSTLATVVRLTQQVLPLSLSLSLPLSLTHIPVFLGITRIPVNETRREASASSQS